MRVNLPGAVSISMAGRTLHEFDSSNGVAIHKSDGLPSPERSGSPELKSRSSQWKLDPRLAYASKEDAHQIDDWPEAHNRKSEDVLVRYKDTRGGKGLSARMDPHAWSDLPTDTDDEFAETATSPAWNGAKETLSPKSATESKTGISSQRMQQPKPTVTSRNHEAVKTGAEVKTQCLASEDHWETDAFEGALRQESDTKSDTQKEKRVTSTTLPISVVTPQNDPRSPSRVTEGEKAREGDDAEPQRVPTLRIVPGRSSFMKSPPRAPTQKGAIDEQATMKMSHRYYTSGVDSNRRRSIPSRVAVKDAESGKEDKHRNRKRKVKKETITVLQAEYKSRTHRGAINEEDSVKELIECSSSSLDSDCSDAECKKGSALCEEEDSEESFRQMILQKYLVKLPEKAKKMQSVGRVSNDTKQKEGQCKSPATSQTKIWSDASDHRYFTGKNLHPISPSRSPSRLQVHVPKKKSCNPEAPLYRTDAVRQTVSQPAAVLEKGRAPLKEPTVTEKSSLMILLRKSWSLGDLRHSKGLGDICTLNGRPLTHREIVDMENSLTEQEKRAIERQIRSKVPKVPMSDDSQTMKSGESCFAMEKIEGKHQDDTCPKQTSERYNNSTKKGIRSAEITTAIHQDDISCPQQTSEGQNSVTSKGNRSVEISTVVLGDLPQTMAPEEGKDVSEFRCDCFPPSVLSKAQLYELSGEMGGAEHHFQGRVAGQGLSALALFPGTEIDSEKSFESGASVLPLVELPSVDGSGGGRIEERQVKLHGRGAKESSDGVSHHRAAGRQAKHGNAAEDSRNGFIKQKFRINKVTAVVPFDSCEGDQVLPDVPLAGQPASHTLLEQQNEVEFKQYIADERRQQVSKHRSTEQHYNGTEMLAQQRRGFWDSSQELQKEKQTLLKRLQELEVQHPCNRLRAMSGMKVQLTEEDAKKLRQEILEQEALIRGYQVENEKAVAKLKEVQLETKQRLQEMAEEKAYLASQLANRHIQRYGTDSDSLHEKLQNALSRETALRIDLDKMRDSYSELEKRVKREESSRMKDLELKLKTLHETLEAERQSHAQMEGRKQAMIQQEELIASLQETVSDQASKIRALTTMQLEGGEGLERTSVSEILDKKEAQQQIETLQAQVKKLEQSLRAAKKETGLQVTKLGMEENETFRRMQAELVTVQRQAHQKEEETNRIIHHLKVENEKIKHESVTRIRNLKQQIQTRAQSGHSISESELSAVNRVKDLEKQLANLRIHYSRKVKELSEKLEEASKPKLEDVLNRNKTLTSSMAPPSRVATTRLIQPAQGKALREAKERIALQEDVISQKDRTIKSLQTQLQEVESNRPGPTCTTSVGPSPVPSMVQGEVQTKPEAQEIHSSSTSEQESMNLRNKGTRLKTGTNMITNDIYATDEVVVLRRELEKSELTREVLQKACNESVEKAVLLTLQHQQAQQLQQIRQSQIKHHRSSECQTPLAGWVDHRSGLEGLNWISARSSSEIANRTMDARLKVMSEEVEEANSMCYLSPRMQQIMSLKKKVSEMEARQQQRETEWQKLLQETKQTSSIEQEYAERKWREALNSKNMEVEKIRLELNTIIEAAMAMQQAQVQMNQNI